MPKIILDGMHGLGDNLHHRAIVRYYLDHDYDVTLITPWPQIYYDLPIKILIPESHLRIQKKNIERYKNDGVLSRQQHDILKLRSQRIWYTTSGIKKNKSVLLAMIEETGIKDLDYPFDFTFKARPEWIETAKVLLKGNTKNLPVLFYRPLIERTEWNGCKNRNPDKEIYTSLIDYIMQWKDFPDFYVVSIADLKPDIEWISGGEINADLEFHNAELDFETLAGLMSLSSLVYCSPGFALVMARAMNIPSICVYGGMESSIAHSDNSETPVLGIDPINPCLCFNYQHPCDKTIDIEKSMKSIDEFIGWYI